MEQKYLSELTESSWKQQKANAFLDFVRLRALKRPLDELPNSSAHEVVRKAAVAAFSPNAGSAILEASNEFVQLVNRTTLLGRMDSDTLKTPANALAVDVQEAPIGAFVAEAGLIPAAAVSLTPGQLLPAKIAFIFAIVNWLLEKKSGRELQKVLIRAIRLAEDRELLSATAGSAGRPAGLLNAASSFTGGGDLAVAVAEMFAHVSGGRATAPYLITSPRAALWLATTDTKLFRDARADGTGNIAGIPLLVSPAATNRLILVDASRVAVWDGGLEVDAADSATIELDDAPTNDPAVRVSAFQRNMAFVKLVRWISWKLTGSNAIAVTTLSGLSGSPS